MRVLKLKQGWAGNISLALKLVENTSDV